MIPKDIIKKCSVREKLNAKRYREMGLPFLAENSSFNADFFDSMLPNKKDKKRLF